MGFALQGESEKLFYIIVSYPGEYLNMYKLATNRNQKATVLMVMAAFLLTFTIIRAAITDITYDEAYTYMAYVQEIHFSDLSSLRYIYNESVANNHWLNTLAIAVFEKMIGVSYCEFVIRLPNLVAFAVYCVYVYLAYRKRMISFICASFLLMNYYLDEFYGLARGYAMAQTCVFAAAFCYMNWKESAYRKHGYLAGCAFWLMLGTYANTVVLLLFPAFGILWLWRLIAAGQFWLFLKKWSWFVILFVISAFFTLRYHLKISEWGMPLFTGHFDFYHSVVRSYIEMLTTNQMIVSLSVVLLCVISMTASVILKREIFTCDLTLSLAVFIVTSMLMNLITHKGYITERAAIPFYGYIVLCIYELWHAAWERLDRKAFSGERKRKLHAAATILVVCVLGFHFMRSLTFTSTTDWVNNYGRSERLLAGYINTGEFPELEDPDYNASNDKFYRVKYWFIANSDS